MPIVIFVTVVPVGAIICRPAAEEAPTGEHVAAFGLDARPGEERAPRSTGRPRYDTATPTGRHDPILSVWTPSIPDEQSPAFGDQHCNREATVGHGVDLLGRDCR